MLGTRKKPNTYNRIVITPAPTPCTVTGKPHHFYSGPLILARLMPDILAKLGPAPDGEIWEVCKHCHVVHASPLHITTMGRVEMRLGGGMVYGKKHDKEYYRGDY